MKNVCKTALCSVSCCFTGSKIYTGDSLSKGIHARQLKNNKWMTYIITIMTNWG